MSDIRTERWDRYADEAQRPPFRLVVSDEETLEFPAPTGAKFLALARVFRQGDLAAALEIMAGDHWPRVRELTAGAGYDALINLSTDLSVHFGITDTYTLTGPSGGTRTESDPRKIRRLVSQGWEVVGEG